EQIGATQSTHARIALVPFDDASEGLPGNVLHHLCEQRLAHVHASPRGRSSPKASHGRVTKPRVQLPRVPPGQPWLSWTGAEAPPPKSCSSSPGVLLSQNSNRGHP